MPRYKGKSDGGRTFLVTAIEKLETLSAEYRKTTVTYFRTALRPRFLKEQFTFITF